MIKGKYFLALLATIVIMLPVTMLACSFDRWIEIPEGEYITVKAPHIDVVSHLIERITIDRGDNTLTIYLKSGLTIHESFTSRQKRDWPSGCPANFGSTRMEVLDITGGQLTIGSIVINNPVLVRNCPPNPELILLREDGQIGGVGTACAGIDKCIHFRRVLVE